jgi:hypothetical protein
MAKKKAVKKTAVKKGSAEAKRKMAKVRKAKKNYVLVESNKQTPVKTTNSGGYLYNYNKKKDESKKAMPPGKRISKKTGKSYWEYRVNRSDKKGSLTGEKHYDTNSHNYNFTISGVKLNFANELSKYVKILEEKQRLLLIAKDNIKRKNNVVLYKDMVKIFNSQIKSLKSHINQLKRKI